MGEIIEARWLAVGDKMNNLGPYSTAMPGAYTNLDNYGIDV